MASRFLIIFLIIISMIPVSASNQPRDTAVMVTLEGVSLEQLAQWDIPEFERFANSGAVCLMNNKCEGAQDFQSNAVTIGAGSRGIGTQYGGMALNAGEKLHGDTAEQIYKLNIGSAAPRADVVHIGIAAVVQINEGKKYEFIPGLLGQKLGESGVTAAVYGNSDQEDDLSRCGALIVMNEKGAVPYGDVGSKTLAADPGRPYGVRTNFDYILKSIQSLPGSRRFVVVEAGDSRRADVWKPYLTAERYDHLKRQSVIECLRFISKLETDLKKNTDRYMIMFAVPAQESVLFEQGYRLTPVVIVGTGVESGLLESGSTRRPGLVANIDLAPTVLEFFGIEKHHSMSGMPLKSEPFTGSVSFLTTLNKQMIETYKARIPVLIGYVALVAIAVILAILTMVFHGTSAKKSKLFPGMGLMRVFLVALLLIPVSFLIAPGFHIYGLIPASCFVLATTFSVSYILNRWLKDPRLIFGVIGIAVAAVYCIDLVNGAKLLKQSVISYDPITGIRLYGLGNESAGVLVGAVLLGVYSVLDYFKHIKGIHYLFVGLVCVAVAVIMGFPAYGTDFGGSLTVLVGAGAAFVTMREKRYRMKSLLSVVACIAILFALVIVVNIMLPPEKQSHIGRAFTEARTNGISVLWDIALRKWAMNVRLIGSSVWTFVLVSLIPGLIFLFLRPVGILKQVLARHPMMNAGFIGVLVGVIMGLLTNDSGISMAATGLMYLAVPLMFLVGVEMDATSKVDRHHTAKTGQGGE